MQNVPVSNDNHFLTVGKEAGAANIPVEQVKNINLVTKACPYVTLHFAGQEKPLQLYAPTYTFSSWFGLDNSVCDTLHSDLIKQIKFIRESTKTYKMN